MRELSKEGHFWLPDTPDKKVSGRLEFHPGTGGKLSLIGGLGDLFTETPKADRIVGLCGARFVTLDNCFQTYHSMRLGGIDTQKFHVGMIFDGILYERDEERTFDLLSFQLRHLFEWTNRSSLEETHRHGPTAFAISVTRLDDVEVEIDAGIGLSLHHGIGLDGNDARRVLTQEVGFHIDFPSPLPLTQVSTYATTIQDLVSIATGRVAEFDVFKLSHPDLGHEDRPQYREYVDLYVEWRARELSDKPFQPHRATFTFESIGGLEGIASWIRHTTNIRHLVSRVMATRYAESMYADDRLFNRCAALDGLHRALTGKTTTKFSRRLHELATMAGNPFTQLVGDVAAWCERVRRERDDHAHQLPGAVETAGAARYYLAESAYWLFIFCVFRHCRFDEKVFDLIQGCESTDWLRKRVAEVLVQ